MGRILTISTALIGFLSGVLIYLVIQSSWIAFFAIIIFSILGLIVAKNKISCVIFVFMIGAGVGLIRSDLAQHRVTPDQIDFYNEQKIEFVGVIVETDIRRDKAKYTVRAEQMMGEKVSGDVLITLEKYPQYRYGDRIRVSGKLTAPGEFEGFSYDNYLSRYGIYSVMYRPWVNLIESGQGSAFWSVMSYLQNLFMQRINQIFPEPHASFEAGLLVGSRKGIPEKLMEQFNITGLTHIIAISGYNITIIIVFVMAALKGLPRRIAFGVAVASIVLFTLFVGASPAVTRASIMGILGLMALNSGRQSNIHLTILFTAFTMVFWNPKILWWDVGFQLSFAAVLGLIYVAPLFDKYSKILPETLGIREAIQMTMSAQVMALPIIILNFERLSLISPLANLLVVFAIPSAMLFGFLAVVASFFIHGLGLILGYITWGILAYIIKIIELMASVPYASVNIHGMRFWMMFGYYALLILFLYFYNKRKISNKVLKNR
jgi:competence protein ComEC